MKTAATAAKEGFGTTFARTSKGTPCTTDVIDLLKGHEYFRGISDAILEEIASFAKVTNYDAASVSSVR